MVAELTFWESFWLEAGKAFFTALFVAGAAALIVRWYQAKADVARSALEADRAEALKDREAAHARSATERALKLDLERAQREARSSFVLQASSLAGSFYFRTQDHFRRKQNSENWGPPDDMELDASYREWASSAEVLENELGFRYGEQSKPVELWHKSRDLLTVRYFGLRDAAGPGLLEINAKGYEDQVHSGLTQEELEKVGLILRTYRETMGELAAELASASITV